MKSKHSLLLVLFVLSSLCLNAQNTNQLQCQMTVDQIQNSQSWDIDDVLSENTQNISILLIDELNQVYALVNQNSTVGMEAHILAIQTAIIEADQISMNYSMFDNDLEFIETLN